MNLQITLLHDENPLGELRWPDDLSLHFRINIKVRPLALLHLWSKEKQNKQKKPLHIVLHYH